MSDAVNQAELGRSQKDSSPAGHLTHLLSLGWSPNAPLIRRYVAKHRLQRQLAKWQEEHAELQAKG